jgi:hypothetical protein
MERFFIGGMRIDQKYNPEGDKVLTNADKTESYKDGKRVDTGDRVNATPGALQRIENSIKEEHPDWNKNQVLNEAKKRVKDYNRHISEQSVKDNLALNGGDAVNYAL